MDAFEIGQPDPFYSLRNFIDLLETKNWSPGFALGIKPPPKQNVSLEGVYPSGCCIAQEEN